MNFCQKKIKCHKISRQTPLIHNFLRRMHSSPKLNEKNNLRLFDTTFMKS